MREFPEGMPIWLRQPTTVGELVAFYGGKWEGPPPGGPWEREAERDMYLSLDRNVELAVSHHDDPLNREDGEHDCGKFTLSYGPGLFPPNADHHFSSENWELVLKKMAEWGLLSPG